MQQGKKPQREWYTASVETVRALAALFILLVVGTLGFFGYRIWETRSLEREAAATIDQARGLIQRLEQGQGASGFDQEYHAAWTSLQEARTHYAQSDWSEALDAAKRSRALLLSIVDALRHAGRAGEAQFIAVQGSVEVRRGERGEWEEARARTVLDSGDYVKTAENGSAEVMFLDGTLYTVRPNTLLLITRSQTAEGTPGEQAIEMEYGWVNLNTSQSGSRVTTPHAEARVEQQSEATVTYDQRSATGRFAAYAGSVSVATDSGEKQRVGELEQVTLADNKLSAPSPLPPSPALVEPQENLEVPLERTDKLVLAWETVPNAARYALQVSRTRLFVDNVIDVDNRERPRATLGVRGEGSFEWRVAALTREGLRGPWSTPHHFRVASIKSAGGAEDKIPPALELDNVQSYGSIFIISGRTEPGASVDVAGETVAVKADGSFTKTVQLEQDGWSFVVVRTRDAAGNETMRRQRVFVDTL
jgi:hypothetical protein